MWWWVEKHTHKGYFSSGRETESSFPHIPFSSLSGIAVNMADFRGRTGLETDLV